MDARNDMRIAQEEIFGPVMTVIPYSGNGGRSGAHRQRFDLRLGRWGGFANTGRAFNVARRIPAGTMRAQGLVGRAE